jgi:iron(III) transport system substrate-binding protein
MLGLPYRALLLALLAVLAAGCGGDDREALTVYSGRTENLVGPILEQFSDETGIAIDVRYGDSVDLALLLAEEGDRTPADVFLSQSPGTVGFLAQEDRLAAIPASVLELVPERFRSTTGRWVGVTARQRVLVYNEDAVDEAELPQSVFDLTGPAFRGRVGVAPENASFQDFVSAMRQLVGDDRTREWLGAIAANEPHVYANNNAIVEAVGRGEIDMGLVNHYYNYRFLEEDPGLPSRNYQFPGDDPGALLLESTATVLAGTDEPDEARRFLEFLLSPEAQRYFADETFEYPLVTGVAPAADLPPLDTLETPSVDIEELGAELRGTAEMIAESGLQG